jgi:hypothetical protein
MAFNDLVLAASSGMIEVWGKPYTNPEEGNNGNSKEVQTPSGAKAQSDRYENNKGVCLSQHWCSDERM